MTFIIDSNRVIAAFIKDSTTREILFDKDFEFAAPDFITIELSRHKNEMIEKADIPENEFDILMSLIFQNITIIPQSEYEELTQKLKNEISDTKDIPYLAAAITIKAEGIWTHDPHFNEQKKIKVFTNIDMLRMSGKVKSE